MRNKIGDFFTILKIKDDDGGSLHRLMIFKIYNIYIYILIPS